MPLTGQEKHFADQIDGLLERVDRVERFLGGRWHIVDTLEAPHVHHFRGPMGPSKWVRGAIAESVCECGAELVRPPTVSEGKSC